MWKASSDWSNIFVHECGQSGNTCMSRYNIQHHIDYSWCRSGWRAHMCYKCGSVMVTWFKDTPWCSKCHFSHQFCSIVMFQTEYWHFANIRSILMKSDVWALKSKVWSLNSEVWSLNSELWTMNYEVWTMNQTFKSEVQSVNLECFHWALVACKRSWSILEICHMIRRCLTFAVYSILISNCFSHVIKLKTSNHHSLSYYYY